MEGTQPTSIIRLVVLTALLVPAGVNAGPSELSYHNPFHPQQCGLAVRYAEKRLVVEPQAARARLVLAEGLLCRGLAGDVCSLDDAIVLLTEIAVKQPADFWARLDLAEAVRARFPASEESLSALKAAADALEQSDLGEASGTLARHIENSRAVVVAYRAWVLDRVAPKRSSALSGGLPAEEMYEFVTLAALLGAKGHAEALFALRIHGGADTPLARMATAELGRGLIAVDDAIALYSRAAAGLCGDGRLGIANSQCQLARTRLDTLRRIRSDRQRCALEDRGSSIRQGG